MSIRQPLAMMFVMALIVASPVFASMGGGGGGASATAPPPPSTVDPAKTSPSPREQAEGLYSQAYEEIARAKQALADGKDKNAQKSFKRAIEWAEKATAL